MSRCSSLKEKKYASKILFRTGFLRILVGARPFLSNGDLMPTFLRFPFTGGYNVTLEGSRDPRWGWVNSHGQQVGKKISITGDRVLTRITSGGT